MTNGAKKARSMHTVFAWLGGVLMACMALPAAAAQIPTSERQVLINLYNSAGGANWTKNTNWTSSPGVFNPPGTECTWFGITCDTTNPSAPTVTVIDLTLNHLVGKLPALDALTNLQGFYADSNQLTGTVPTLAALTNLQSFDVGNNQLTGSIPLLTGLSSLGFFIVNGNQLTGSIPSFNWLTYITLPGGGTIPTSESLTNLKSFNADGNQLSGPIPSLGGLTNLQSFSADGNQLGGQIPALTGLANLIYFDVGHNQLSGSIPLLGGLTNLRNFTVTHNALDGSVPALPSNLATFRIDDNALTGNIPAAPAALSSGQSIVCPNLLTLANSPESANDQLWDAATGIVPWSQACASIQLSTTSITTLSPSSPSVGTATTINFTVVGTGSTAPTGTVSVSDSVDGTATCGPVTIVNGAGSCPLTFQSTGSHTLTAVYEPDSSDVNTYTPSSGTYTISANLPPLNAPTVALNFIPASVAIGGTTTLTATLTNPNSVALQLNSTVTITGLPGGATLDAAHANSIACSDGSGANDPPTVVPANGGTCTLTFTNVSAGTAVNSYTATWPSNASFITTFGSAALNIAVNTTTTATANLIVTSSGGTGTTGGSAAPAPSLSAWALMLLGALLLFSAIGYARRSPRKTTRRQFQARPEFQEDFQETAMQDARRGAEGVVVTPDSSTLHAPDMANGRVFVILGRSRK